MPFPIPTTTNASDVGPGTPFPLGMTGAKVMEVYWRAKKLSFQAPCTATVPAHAFDSAIGAVFPASDLMADFTSTIIEMDLTVNSMGGGGRVFEGAVVADQYWIANVVNSTAQDVSTSMPYPFDFDPAFVPSPLGDGGAANVVTASISFSAKLTIFDQVVTSFGLARMLFYNGLYYPSMDVTWGMTVEVTMNDEPETFPLPATPTGAVAVGSFENAFPPLNNPIIGTGTGPSLSGSIFDQDLTTAGWKLTFDPNTSFNDGFGDTSPNALAAANQWFADLLMSGMTQLTIKITEWWPYDPGDGLGPFWDATTGAQLRL